AGAGVEGKGAGAAGAVVASAATGGAGGGAFDRSVTSTVPPTPRSSAAPPTPSPQPRGALALLTRAASAAPAAGAPPAAHPRGAPPVGRRVRVALQLRDRLVHRGRRHRVEVGHVGERLLRRQRPAHLLAHGAQVGPHLLGRLVALLALLAHRLQADRLEPAID